MLPDSIRRAVLVALAVLLLPLVIATPIAAQEPTPASADPALAAAEQARQGAAATRAPIAVTGDGRGNSAPFALAGGAYIVDWSAGDTTMLSAIVLLSASDAADSYTADLLDMGDGPAVRSGQARIADVKSGSYYLSVRVSGPWRVVFTPDAAAPEQAPGHAALSTDPAGCAVVGVRPFEPSDPCVSALGAGAKQTAPFRLEGGAYRVEWAMRQPGQASASIQLLAADADDLGRWRLIVRQPVLGANGNAADETHIYNLKPGSYFLKVDAPADWVVRLYPITP